MANYPRWYASITLQDYAQRKSTVTIRVPEATAKLYFAAADKAARDATAIGVWFAAVLACTAMTEVQRSVTVTDETAPVTAAAEDVVRGNKIVMYGQTGPDGYTLSIPGRNESAYALKENSIEINMGLSDAFQTMYEQLQTVGLGNGGLSIDIQSAQVND